VTIRLAGLAIFLAMGACAWRGPDAIVGPVGTAGHRVGDGGTIGLFASSYEASRQNPASSPEAYRMVQVGSELQYQLCKDFFRGAGKEQQWLLFGKDALATIGSVTAGIIGATGGPAAAVAWVGLSTAAGVTGINLYERNFLFSENNVKAVEDLTLKALGAARDVAISADRSNAYDFPSAVSALMDIQGICEVQNILDMVRKSIGIAQPFATDDTDTATSAIIRAQLGNLFIGNVSLTRDELQALYWVIMAPPTADADRRLLAARLANLNPSPLLPDGTRNPAFTDALRVQVRVALGRLPPSVAAALEKDIKPGAAVAPPPGAPPGFAAVNVPSRTAPRTLGRIRIDIR